jgi:hypothetical protein
MVPAAPGFIPPGFRPAELSDGPAIDPDYHRPAGGASRIDAACLRWMTDCRIPPSLTVSDRDAGVPDDAATSRPGVMK